MLTKDKFTEIMTGLSEMFNKPLSEFMLDMYWDILKDYPSEQIGRAIKRCLKEYKYNTIPKPADILEYLEGSASDKSLIAWMKAKEAVRKGGYVATIEFDDPIISHCLKELGGWQSFCNCPIDELPFVEKRFRDLYNLLQKREIINPVRLIGFIEQKNSERGHNDKIPKPILIGDLSKKKMVAHE